MFIFILGCYLYSIFIVANEQRLLQSIGNLVLVVPCANSPQLRRGPRSEKRQTIRSSFQLNFVSHLSEKSSSGHPVFST